MKRKIAWLVKILKVITLLLLGYAIAIYAYRPPIPQDQPKSLPEVSTPPKSPQYLVDIPAKYFDPDKIFEYGDTLTLEGIKVTYPPVEIEYSSETELINEEFKGLSSFPRKTTHLPKYLESINVDDNYQAETIVFVPTAMNHAAGEIWIIKDGFVIFKSEDGANISITESKSHNGFYISEAISSGTGLAFFGGYRQTRYIYENGTFRPVWYQDTFDLQTTQP